MWEALKEAVARSTKLIEATWKQNGMAIAKTGNYARSIISVYPADDEGFAGTVINTAPYAAALEFGRPPFDMKPYLLASKKARLGRYGSKYLRVPFRHGIPEAVTLPPMPKEIYQEVRRKGRIGERLEGWRSKLTPKGPYTWTTGPYSGMQRLGRERHSQYMTFRTVSDRSPASSWWHPGIKARRIAERTVEQVVPQIERLLAEAVDRDLQDILGKVVRAE
ncbi:MAG: hypothetical protein ACPL5F_01370 [Moorellaceae bacterium]